MDSYSPYLVEKLTSYPLIWAHDQTQTTQIHKVGRIYWAIAAGQKALYDEKSHIFMLQFYWKYLLLKNLLNCVVQKVDVCFLRYEEVNNEIYL